jgi:acetone carboxylase gamma subunit
MRVNITEYLGIDLSDEMWFCRCCNHKLISARDNYKRGLLVYDRDPREIHPPLIDASKYEYTFAPDPAYTALLEFYCPSCGTMVETEYTVPGHPPVHDIELDIDSLHEKVKTWGNTYDATVPIPMHPPKHVHPPHDHKSGHGDTH